MKLHVLHRTRFAYGAPVRDSLNEVRLQPVDTAEQGVRFFSLTVSPAASPRHQLDFYHNHVHRFDVLAPHPSLTVEAVSHVETRDFAPPGEGASVLLGDMRRCENVEYCYDFLQPSAYVVPDDDVRTLARNVIGGRLKTWEAALALHEYVHAEFRYQPAVTTVHTRTTEALRLRCGVCQDFAHVMIALCRSIGLPARYVSGYLYNGPADQLRGAQASHAWLEVFLPGRGWLGLDPTNGRQAGERHVKVAVGRDYGDVSPLRGTYRGTGQRTLQVDVLVSLLDEQNAPVPAAAAP